MSSLFKSCPASWAETAVNISNELDFFWGKQQNFK